jgi:hypothetical protein
MALSADPPKLSAEEQIEARQSALHVGQSVRACGRVAQVTGRAEVTYINLDNAYPNHSLGLVIWRSDLPAYEARLGALSSLVGKRICARGVIEQYRSRLQIVLRNPQDLLALSSAPPQAQGIKISTWYIAGLRLPQIPGESFRTQDDIDRLEKYATRLNATVVALQSVVGRGAAEQIFGSDYTFHFTAGRGFRSGFAVQRGVSFALNPDLPLLPPQVAASAATSARAADITLTEGASKLRLLSVEFEPQCSEAGDGDVGPACERLSSNFRQVASWVRTRQRNREPFVVLGNFNRVMRGGRDDLNNALSGTIPLVRANEGLSSPCWVHQELNPRPFEDHFYLGGAAREWLVPRSLSVMTYDEQPSSMTQISFRCPVSIRLRLSANLR